MGQFYRSFGTLNFFWSTGISSFNKYDPIKTDLSRIKRTASKRSVYFVVVQADNLALPLALLLASTFLPPALLILALKPWTFDLCLFLGWNVIFMIQSPPVFIIFALSLFRVPMRSVEPDPLIYTVKHPKYYKYETTIVSRWILLLLCQLILNNCW